MPKFEVELDFTFEHFGGDRFTSNVVVDAKHFDAAAVKGRDTVRAFFGGHKGAYHIDDYDVIAVRKIKKVGAK